MNRRGFTIVELLIVIVVIAILAAITIVAYNGIQNRAKQSSAQTAVSQANKKILAYAVLNSDDYPPSLAAAGITDTTGLEYSYDNNSTPHTYGITATNGTFSYYMSSTVSSPTSGGYPGHSQGGVATITNMVVNPSFENGLNTYSIPSNAGLSIATDWAASGTSSARMIPPTASNDSFFGIGGDIGAFRAGMQAGKTYTISATVRLSAPLTGAFSGNGTRQITAWYANAAGSNLLAAQSNQAPNSAGTTRVSLTYSIPSDATAAFLRFYHGGSSGSGTVWYDNIMITEGATQRTYADGTSQNWTWNGVPHNSTSTGIPL